MEQVQSSRRSSGLYDFDAGSTASLSRNTAPPSGSRFSEVHRTTAAGVPVDPASRGSTEAVPTAGSNDMGGAAQPAARVVPWYKRRKFLISQAIIIPLGIALLFILLFPVVTAIAQLVVNRSVINIDEAAITSPQNNSFNLALKGVVTHTGIISATIDFTEPVDIAWVQQNGTQTSLGVMELHRLRAHGKRATIDDQTVFNITDQDAFGRFTESMITAENFTWRMYSDNLHVQAAKFPVSKGIKFEKFVTLKGFNSFQDNVVLKDLQLPSDNPKENGSGINFITTTGLSNPSPFNINLGTVVFALSYDGVDLGEGSSDNTQIKPSDNDITLNGYLKPHDDEADLKTVSRLFTNYLNADDSIVIAKGKSTLQPDGTIIPWLSQGLQALTLEVPFISLAGAIAPIKSITIGDLALLFVESDPWAPIANSQRVQAALELPFGFNIEIGQIQNEFNISRDGSTVAGLATPLGASTSDISVFSSSKTAGTVNITIKNTRLNTDHPNFAAFNTNITSSDIVPFHLIGHSRAVANTSIGQLTLDPIKFNVSSSLDGLQGLNGMTVIDTVDVTGGSVDGILLGINVTINNPSNLQLSTGDLTLQLHRNGAVLGTVLLPNLTLNMGSNALLAQSIFKPNDNAQALQTLNDFVGQKDCSLSIVGYDGSTGIASLSEAFQTLDIDVVLPGLISTLLKQASLQVLATTGRTDNISHVSVDLANPFSADLKITKVQSSISSFGIPLGKIDVDTDFSAGSHSTTTSPKLDLNQNLDPSALFTLTRNLAVEAGLDVAPLDGIVEIGEIQYMQDVKSSADRKRDNLFSGFDLPTFVQTAFKKLQSDVELLTEVTIGDYSTTLTYAQNAVTTETDESLGYLLTLLAQPIVQKIVTASVLGIDTVIISNPKQESFKTALKGSITNAGPFDAVLSFGEGLNVAWNGKALGNINMHNLSITGDVGGDIEMESDFKVLDVDHLADFTKVLLTEEDFAWEISGDGIVVSALGVEIDGLTLSSKTVTLKGFNGLQGGVTINSFDLPSDDPDGGIDLTLETTINSPSQVGIELSSLGFASFFEGVLIAPVATKETVTLSPGAMTNMSLVGRLVPQESDAGLAAVSTVFNNFIHGKNSDLVVHGASAGPSDVSWLNEGIKALQVDTALPNQGVLDIIKSISLNQLELLFTQDTAYGPATSSHSTDVAFTLPFGFPIDIVSLEQTITVAYDGDTFAELVIPRGLSETDVEKRIIHLSFSDVPFAVYNDKHSTFNDFVASTTINKEQALGLAGSANTDASTAVGLLSLSGIAFDVESIIDGLQGLNTEPTIVSDLDVYEGYADYLLIKVKSSLFNPSNLTIGTDDVSFGLQFKGQRIGSANIAHLLIEPGNQSYPTDVRFSPQGSASEAAGRELLQNYIQGVDSDTSIAGNTDSTPIESLKAALSQIVLSPVTISAMHDTLIKSVSLTFPKDIVQTGIADASFTLANPFTTNINLLTVGTTATYQGIELGTIDADVSSNPIHADGHSNVTSETLDLQYNLDPITIIQFLAAASKANDVDLGPLNALFQIVLGNPEYHPPVNTTVDPENPTCVSGDQYNIAAAILSSLRNLRVDLDVNSAIKLDEYPTDLSFKQSNIPAITDATALYLIGAVAGPVAQVLVNQAILSFSEANITNLSNEGFDLSLVGSLTNTGPLDALITFTEPLTVNWEGNNIAEIELEPVCAAANAGVPSYNTQARLTITNTDQFTNFATYLLHDEEFSWKISTDKLRLTALGTIFDNISLEKTVSFKAFNNLPGVTIDNFELPSDDEAGGIHVETDAFIPSPAQLGIDLGTAGFLAYYEGTLVGPLSASDLFLAANSQTPTHLSGRIVEQSGDDINTIGVLFSDFLQGKNSTLLTRGDSVQPSGSSSPVDWLSTAFKTLELSVILPGKSYDVIQSITLNDLSVTMTEGDQAYAPLTGSKNTMTTYKNPFGFSLEVFESGQTINMESHGLRIASLTLPMVPADGGVSTGNEVPLQIAWSDVPLLSSNDAAFNQLFAAVTLAPLVDLTLKGSADVRAHTAIGDVPISGIEFDVESTLSGIAGFGGSADLSDVSVSGGTSDYIITDLTTRLQNPSNVTLHTTDVALPVIYDGVSIGRASIDPYDLFPGTNDFSTEFYYQPDNANDTTAQAFLTRFMTTGDDIPLNIDGDSRSTPYGSLQPALDGIALKTTLTGLNQPIIITSIRVVITLETLLTNEVTINFKVYNPLDTPMQITFVQSDASVEGEVYAFFTQPIQNFVIPPHEEVDSGPVQHVLLVKGALLSLEIIPLGYLDIETANTAVIGDDGGYEVPWLKLKQDRVPTTYELELGLDELLAKGRSMSASSVAVTATTDLEPTIKGGSSSITGKATDESSTRPASPLPSNSPDDVTSESTLTSTLALHFDDVASASSPTLIITNTET